LGVGGFDLFFAAALAAAARIVDAVVGPDRIDAALSIDPRVFRRDTLSSWLMRALSSASDSPVPKCDGCARSPHCVSWKWDGWYKSPGGPSSSVSESSGRGPPARVAGWEARDIFLAVAVLLGCPDLSSECVGGCPRRPRGCQAAQDSLVTCPSTLLSGQGTV